MFACDEEELDNIVKADTRNSCKAAKPRILLIADVPNWIFARHCRMLERFLADEFTFAFKIMNDPYCEADYDLIYPLEWNLISRDQIRSPGKHVTGIRSYVSWQGEDFLPFIDFLATHFQRVHLVSRRLQCLFAPFLPDTTLLSHGVDTEFFTPATAADRSGRGRLRIGWAGNRINTTKGFEHHVAPLAQLPGIELCFCGFQDHNVSMDGMRDFYETIDAYVCASSHEGNNNTLMEAAAMRRAIITTDNGAVPEYLYHGENALIVERELPAFIHAVVQLRDDPILRVRLGNAARESVKSHFEWKDRAEDYRSFFREALSRRDQFRPRIDSGSRAVALPEEIKAGTVPTLHAPLSSDNPNRTTDSACVSPHESRVSRLCPNLLIHR
jgi:glycosyltransferase involved in cell wall biosynthesis